MVDLDNFILFYLFTYFLASEKKVTVPITGDRWWQGLDVLHCTWKIFRAQIFKYLDFYYEVTDDTYTFHLSVV